MLYAAGLSDVTRGQIEASARESSTAGAVRLALAGELGGFLALGATLSPVAVLRAFHGWLVATGVDPAAAAVLVVAGVVVRWGVGVSLFVTRAVEW